MTKFRPCIDLHSGQVKQIVGGTLSTNVSDLKTNFVSTHAAAYYAGLYRDTKSEGAHLIMLGPGNNEAAKEALKAWPGKLQVGGGVTDQNARRWIEDGAERVIVTSYLFPEGKFSLERLKAVLNALGNQKNLLVIDLSCRRSGSTWFVAMNKWQTITEMEITQGTCLNSPNFTLPQELMLGEESIQMLEPYCSEFLIHAADNEGLQQGIDVQLVRRLSEWCSIPVTYAGGARTVEDLELVRTTSNGKVDLTIGSALDIFGGSGAKFEECIAWNRSNS